MLNGKANARSGFFAIEAQRPAWRNHCSQGRARLASHADVFRAARISSLLTNACSIENNIPFPTLANHIVPSKFWKVDLDHRVHSEIFMTTLDSKVRFSQISEYSVHCMTPLTACEHGMVRGCAVSGEPPMLHNRMKEGKSCGQPMLDVRPCGPPVS